MSHPSDHSDSPSHLRIDDGSSPVSPRPRGLRILAAFIAGVVLLLAIIPFVVSFPATSQQAITYALGLAMVLLIDLGFAAVLLTWRSVARSKLGEWQFTVDGFQSSLYRNLILGGTMQCVAIFVLWLPLLIDAADKNSNVGFALFMTMSGVAALASTPWIVQFVVNVKGHDLEVHDEGLMIGGFYPCRWERIVSYHVWDDACSLITFDIRGRGPVEVFMSPIDRQLLCEELEAHIGPPASEGRSNDLPNDQQPGQFGQLSIFR